MKFTNKRIKIIETVKPLLKKDGFKKVGCSWYRQKNNFVQVFNIQASQFGEEFYVNVAIGFPELISTETPAEHKCQVRSRINHRKIDAAKVADEAIFWFLKYDSLDKLIKHLDKKTLPATTTIQAKEYLKKIKKNRSNIT